MNCNGKILVVDKPLVMGIINMTPDSFFSESRLKGNDAILRKAGQMLDEGATILDIGGQSTRPGSKRISSEEESKRVIEPIEMINRHFPEAFISVDTFYGEVAKKAVEAGAGIINDTSAGSLDPGMIGMVATLKVPYVLMHMQGEPGSMQENPVYTNVTKEVLDFFSWKIKALREAGIPDIIIDPGFGFGKTITHNFQLLHELPVFSMLECPLLLGISRKGTIYKTLGITAGEALNGTTVLNTLGLANGAMILRVHDVKEAVEATRLYQAYKKSFA